MDAKFTGIYDHFTSSRDNIKKIDTRTLFLLCASIGYKHSKKTPLTERDKETRGSFLKIDEESLIFNISYSDAEFAGDIEKLAQNDRETVNKVKKIYEEYANGGMEILVDKVFKDNWDGKRLEENYKDYHYDLARFILSEIKVVPF